MLMINALELRDEIKVATQKIVYVLDTRKCDQRNVDDEGNMLQLDSTLNNIWMNQSPFQCDWCVCTRCSRWNIEFCEAPTAAHRCILFLVSNWQHIISQGLVCFSLCRSYIEYCRQWESLAARYLNDEEVRVLYLIVLTIHFATVYVVDWCSGFMITHKKQLKVLLVVLHTLCHLLLEWMVLQVKWNGKLN